MYKYIRRVKCEFEQIKTIISARLPSWKCCCQHTFLPVNCVATCSDFWQQTISRLHEGQNKLFSLIGCLISCEISQKKSKTKSWYKAQFLGLFLKSIQRCGVGVGTDRGKVGLNAIDLENRFLESSCIWKGTQSKEIKTTKATRGPVCPNKYVLEPPNSLDSTLKLILN